ncbi:MAG: hypothetical protein R3F56_22605 [Planctomycetota bacterium]
MRLLGHEVRALLETDGSHLRTMVESDRGVRGRIARGGDDLGLVAGCNAHEENMHGLERRVLGYHVLVAVVHESRSLRDLSGHALRSAATGHATLWSHLGADRPEPIEVVAVAEDAFTDQASSQVLMGERMATAGLRLPTDADVCRYVAEHETALGLCSLAAALRCGLAVRVLTVDSVTPSATEFVAGRYPLAAPVCVLAKDHHRLAWLDRLPLDALSR